MAVNIPIDNAVIDFTQITSLLATLQEHDNLFTSLTGSNMATITAINSNLTSTPNPPQYISASNLGFVGVKYMTQLADGNARATVSFGTTFDSAPIVTATAKLVGTSSTAFPVVFLTDIQNGQCSIAIHDTSGGKAKVTVEVQILAMGLAHKTIA